MIVYRICNTYPPDHNPIDGQGAFRNGGRWNSKGTYAVYTASSLALARAELARHMDMESIPDGYRVYEVELPDDKCQPIGPLPSNWDDDPPSPISQRFEDKWLNDSTMLGFKVRSVCDPNSFNLVLNPQSVHFSKVRIVRSYPFQP